MTFDKKLPFVFHCNRMRIENNSQITVGIFNQGSHKKNVQLLALPQITYFVPTHPIKPFQGFIIISLATVNLNGLLV